MAKPVIDMADILGNASLQTAPIPIARATPTRVETPSEVEQERTERPETRVTDAYIPEERNREPIVTWSCKMPLRLRAKLEEIAGDYDQSMSKIVVDLLERELPKIPRRKRKRE